MFDVACVQLGQVQRNQPPSCLCLPATRVPSPLLIGPTGSDCQRKSCIRKEPIRIRREADPFFLWVLHNLWMDKIHIAPPKTPCLKP